MVTFDVVALVSPFSGEVPTPLLGTFASIGIRVAVLYSD